MAVVSQQIVVVQGEVAACVRQFRPSYTCSTPKQERVLRPFCGVGSSNAPKKYCGSFPAVAVPSYDLASSWAGSRRLGPVADETIPG